MVDSLFGKSKKCYYCGVKEGLSTCSCGKRFCPLHGVGELCNECYSAGLVKHAETVVRLPDNGKKGKTTDEERTEDRDEKGFVRAGSSIKFEPLGEETLLIKLSKVLGSHHFISFAQRRVKVFDEENEVEVQYHGDRVLNSIRYSTGELDLRTDLRRIRPKAMEKIDLGNLGECLRRMHGDFDAYKSLLHHNEISWLLQTILLSLGSDVSRAELEWRLGDLPIRAYGPMCPWCGTSVAAQGKMCRFCGREVPVEVTAENFIRSHLKRQFKDKLIGLRSFRQEGEISPETYRVNRSRLQALLESVDRVRWDEPYERT